MWEGVCGTRTSEPFRPDGVRKMRSEDAEQLAVLWTGAQAEVGAFLRSVMHASEVADVLQQVAVKLVRNFDAYDRDRPFTPWAIGIAKHEVLAWRRKQATDRHRFSDEIVQRVADAFAQSHEEDRRVPEALQECLKQVEGRGRKVLDMHYGSDMKTDRIAATLNLSGGAVRMLLCRVRDALRECIRRRLTSEEVA